jgi:hypothetical protein
VIDPTTAVVAATGKPYSAEAGTFDPLLVEVMEVGKGSPDVKKIARDLCWLTEMNWAEPLKGTKLPIHVHLANKMALYVTDGVEFDNLPW